MRETYLKNLNLRPQVLELLLGNFDCGAFSDYFQAPEYFYSHGSPENPGLWPELGERKLVPLWEHSEFIYSIDTLNDEVISFHIENPNEIERYKSIDDAIFKMIELHVWEYGGTLDEINESIRFAKQIALPNLAGLKKLLVDHMACTEDMLNEFRATL